MAQETVLSQSYNSFSGVDIRAVFNGIVLAELQAISYSVTREKAPIYTMGSADPRSFSRGKRGIAGSLIFIMFDRHALLHHAQTTGVKFSADIDDVRPETQKNAGLSIGNAETNPLESDQENVAPWYSDQIPPFDVTLAAANEYGAVATMRIYGVELLNEGYGVSIDDIVSEHQMTYVCRTLLPWQAKTPKEGSQAATGGGTAS